MESTIRNREGTISANLDIIVYKDDQGHWIVYAPSLDLSDYGDSEKDVLKAFKETLNIFLKDTVERGTLERELIRLGWTLSKEKYAPPKISPDTLNRLRGLDPKIIEKPVNIPAYAS